MSSFPFFAIAQQRNIPYGKVLAEYTRIALAGSLRWGIDQAQSDSLTTTVAKAIVAEHERRIQIANMTPTFQQNLLGNA